MANFSIGQVDTSQYAHLMKGKGKSNIDLEMDSFLQLMAAQIQNQDVMNPTSNEDYVAQMVQMTMIQAITNMMDMSMTSYATSMVGKTVTIAEANGSAINEVIGVVSGVSIYGDEPIIHVNGRDYKLSQVMVVGSEEPQENKVEPETEPETETEIESEKEPEPTEGGEQE